MSQKVELYQVPKWAQSLKSVPSSVVKLAMTPTPIHDWKLPGTPDGFKILIKRDDMTGSTLSGNKVRKLEFIFSDLVERSVRHVVTTGPAQSNHCVAVAVACAQLGLECHLIQWIKPKEVDDLKFEGNSLTTKLCGSHIYLVPEESHSVKDTIRRAERLTQHIKEETGEKAHYIAVGGSDELGVWGYIQCFEEIRQQGVEFDDLVCVCGSGGTAGGLAIANYICGSPHRCHAIMVGTHSDFNKYVNERLVCFGIADVSTKDIISLHDYSGLGYGRNQPEELEFIAQTAQQTGILLDNSYTGKAAYGLSDLLQKKPEVFKGKRILFVHSGGIASLQVTANREALLPHATKSKVTLLEDDTV